MTFSELAFSFRITLGIILQGMVFSLVMGLIGGLFPAWRAAHESIVNALRST